MAGRRVLTVEGDLIVPERLACVIAEKYDKWKMSRAPKEAAMAEVRNYIFATDTTTTTNSKLPWKNKTTRPKLCNIRDNLHANYMAALFPNEDWFEWQPADEGAAELGKARAITLYIKNKLKQQKFEDLVSKLVYDLIDWGVVFGDTEYVTESYTTPAGETITYYEGPRAYRISPYDIVFDISSPSFEQAPKITRTLLTHGDIAKLTRTHEMWKNVDPAIIQKMRDCRTALAQSGTLEVRKSEGFIADGFGSLAQYYSSGMVEVLEFEGDIYLEDTQELLENYVITVVDRAYVIRKEPVRTWNGKSTKQYCGWRSRSDNLWAMGPLDNLVGLQYRIDHLENLKADVFDLIAYPVLKIKGYVEDFDYGPLARIYMEQDSEVETIVPDTTALNADLQIQELEQQMEEMAGAPKQAMGIRTPGEKTKFEVQTLENSTGRIYQNKVSYFEKNFLEPLLNDMVEQARRNMSAAEAVRYTDEELGVENFLTITKEDLQAKGRLVPIGARHFAAQAQLVQNLSALSGTGLYQDPSVMVHFSGLKMAKLLEENLGLSKYGIVQPNIRIIESTETQRLTQTGQDQTMAESLTPALTEEDVPQDAPQVL